MFSVIVNWFQLSVRLNPLEEALNDAAVFVVHVVVVFVVLVVLVD